MERSSFPVELAIALLLIGGLVYFGHRSAAERAAATQKMQGPTDGHGGPGNTGARVSSFGR